MKLNSQRTILPALFVVLMLPSLKESSEIIGYGIIAGLFLFGIGYGVVKGYRRMRAAEESKRLADEQALQSKIDAAKQEVREGYEARLALQREGADAYKESSEARLALLHEQVEAYQLQVGQMREGLERVRVERDEKAHQLDAERTAHDATKLKLQTTVDFNLGLQGTMAEMKAEQDKLKEKVEQEHGTIK